MTDPDHRQSVRAAFERAAETYDGAATVQREVCERLDALIDQSITAAPTTILDAGCGTGFGLPLLARRFPAARLLAVDFAPAMLRRLPPGLGLALGADLECLPLPAGCVDAVWSSLALQWCRPVRALRELHRVLAPGGPAWLATLGPATLQELRAAFAGIDSAEHVIAFHDLVTWAGHAEAAGFRVVTAEETRTWATAPTLHRLLKDIKAIGAHAVGGGRRRSPLGKAAWRSLEATYEIHRRPDGLLPATYDLILLHLEKPK
jgi:malonyl-CoA O-methyltransferase